MGWFMEIAVIAVLGMFLNGGVEPAPQEERDLDAAFAEVKAKSGPEYVAARDRLLAMDKAKVAAFLASKHDASTDRVERLWIESLSARLRDPQRLDKAMADAIAAASPHKGVIMHFPGAPEPPQPGRGAGLLMRTLGKDAVPLATELLTKGLTDDWEPWKREIPLWTLAFQGRSRTPDDRGWTPVKDWRAAWPLLWVAEHEKNERFAGYACGGLAGFPSEELAQAIEAATQRTTSDVVKRRLRDGPRYLRRLKAIADTQPGFGDPVVRPRSGGRLPMSRPAPKSGWVELPVGPASRPATQTAPATSTRPASKPAP
jgi:hypothetical protein